MVQRAEDEGEMFRDAGGALAVARADRTRELGGEPELAPEDAMDDDHFPGVRAGARRLFAHGARR
jgi:hypothetical protein